MNTLDEMKKEITLLEVAKEEELCLLSILSLKVAALMRTGKRPTGIMIKKKFNSTTTAITSITMPEKNSNNITAAI